MEGSINSRERILAAARREKVDRVPVTPWGLGKFPPDSAMHKELLEKTDPIIGAGGCDPFLGKLVKTETITEGDITTTLIETPKGELVRRRQKTDITSATIEFPLKGPEDVEKLLSIPYEPPDINADAFHQEREEIGGQALVSAAFGGNPVCVPASWFSPEEFCIQWIEHPDVIVQLVSVAAERQRYAAEELCKAGVDAFRMVGGEYVSVQLGPSAVGPLLKDFDTEIIAIIHRYGGVVFYHNHGPIMRYLADYVELGFDVLDPLEAPPWGDADLARAKEIIDGRFTILGNLDDMEVLGKYSEDEVKAMARANLEAYGIEGHILGGTTSGTFTEHAARNFIALVEVAEEFGGNL
ncbi:MAG: hypothetical protein GXP25_17820 [Planctomycetes bacterium]|nr:hypothetical protein [Planctomycetota bacterium]